MKKLHAVRDFLIEAMPEYRQNPDNFVTFVEDGKVTFYRGESLSHGYSYTAQLVMLEFCRDVDHVMLPLLMWLRRYQPDADPNEAVQFEAEILDEGVVDLIVRVRLDERVVVTADQHSGAVALQHRAPSFDIGLPEQRRWTLEQQDLPGGTTWTI